MNELQVRLSADISALQSALTKAKQTIKSFEESTNNESNKSNVGFKRKIGLIEQLTNKANTLRVALSKATNEDQVERYNRELENTSREMSRLNALGRSVTSNLGGTANGFNKLTGSIGNANGVSMEFNRIIQDAPFGLIGIGNNIQQLTANFAQLKAGGASTGAVIKASLAAMISPANLLVLGISAITAAFTAYQMGAFDFLKSNEKAKKSFSELAESIKNAASSSYIELTNLNSLRSIIEDETLSREKREKAIDRLQQKYPAIFANADREKLLNGQLIQSYDLLAKSILQRAEASIAESELPELVKQKQLVDGELKAKQALLATEQDLLETRNRLTPISQTFSGSDYDNARRRIIDLKDSVGELATTQKGLQINIDGFTESIISYNDEFQDLLEPVNTELTTSNEKIQTVLDSFTDSRWQEAEDNIRNISNLLRPIAEGLPDIVTLPEGLPQPEIADEVDPEENAQRIRELTGLIKDQKLSVDDLSGAFTGLGSLIGKTFDNVPLGQFAGQFAQFVTKIIAGAFAVSKANAIAGATQSSLFTGPAAAFTLPAFIAGAIGLVASAFAGLGGRGGGGSRGGSAGGGGFTSSSPPQIFTNQNTVQPPTPTGSPNFNSGDIDFTNAQSRLTVDVHGDYLQFILDRNKERKAGG